MSRAIERGADSTVWRYSATPPPPPPPLLREELASLLGDYGESPYSVHEASAYGDLLHLNAESDVTKWAHDLLQRQYATTFDLLLQQHATTDEWVSKIADATTPKGIASALQQRGMERSAGRILALSEFHGTDPEEPEVNLKSLRRLATAMIENPAWGEPRLTLNDEGYMHAEWSTVENGRVAMTFLPSDLVDFAAISAPVKSGADVKRIGGRHIGVEAINAVRWFAARIAPR